MEIQDLKSLWIKVVDAESTKYQLEKSDVQLAISKRSSALLSRIKRELHIKKWIFGCIGIVALLMSPIFMFDGNEHYIFDSIFSRKEMTGLTFILGLVLMILCVNIIINYRKIDKLEKSSDSLKRTLIRTKEVLNGIKKINVHFDVFLIPIIFSWALSRRLFLDSPIVFDIRILYIVLATILSCFFIYYFSKHLQDKKFKPYISELEVCINDIEFIEQGLE